VLNFPITRRWSRSLRPSLLCRPPRAKRGELRRSLNSDFCKSPNPNPNFMENPRPLFSWQVQSSNPSRALAVGI
jgi:hypothetical protein